MDNGTQHQNCNQSGDDLCTDNEEEKVHEVQGSKLDGDSETESQRSSGEQ